MGHYPKQYFVYGIMVDEDRAAELDTSATEDVCAFCEENGFDYAFGGSAIRSDPTGLVVGFELDTHGVVEGGYVGGYHVTKFDANFFNDWLAESKAEMTPEVVAKIQGFLKTEEQPALWTVSSFG